MRRNVCDVQLPVRLPLKFWGGATSGHQVEGGFNSNWSNWEISEQRVKKLWDEGKNPDDFISGRACEFDTRFCEDLVLAKSLGHNALRFGIGWDTVERAPGIYDRETLERLRKMVREMRKNDIEPIFTYYHWTHPQWFEDMGGWANDNAPMLFARFVEQVDQYIGDKVDWYTVLNETNVYANFSYRWAIWPPQLHEKDDGGKAYRAAISNLAHAHRAAYDIIKAGNRNAKVGIAHNAGWNESADPAVKAEKDGWNYEFTDMIAAHLDFIGINLYMHGRFDPGKEIEGGWDGHDPCDEHPVVNDFPPKGWGMCPRAIYEVIKEFSYRYPGMPMMVTEHGHAVREMEDDRRCWYLWESLKWISKALEEGIDLRGYLHWSLMDNFEWAEGYAPQFGLIHINRKTMERTPRRSAYLFRDIIAAGGLTKEIALQYRDLIKHPHE